MVFNDEFLKNPHLGIDVTFETFACTGAITLNIYDPADPNPTPPPGTAHDTDRPSPHAALGRPTTEREPPNQIVVRHERDPLWEPRQATSLEDERTDLKAHMRDVDMITLTIGGNDLGFADGLESCVSPAEFDGGCGSDDLTLTFREVEERILDVLERLKALAPEASIFVLGYPYLTPEVDPCAEPVARPGSRPGAGELVHESPECEAARNMYLPPIRDCEALSATGVIGASDRHLFGLAAQALAALRSGSGRIDYSDAKFMRSTAVGLNAAVMRAATRARVHFVDVVGGVSSAQSFVGHSSCDDAPWLNGFVVDREERPIALAGRSFHPTEAGHRGYAEILERYVLDELEGGSEFNEAGLPVNPMPLQGSGHGSRSGADSALAGGKRDAGGARQPGESSQSRSGSRVGGTRGSTGVSGPSYGHLIQHRVVAVASGCGAPFVSPGEQIRLVTGGFAPGSTVNFSVRAASAGGTALGALSLPAVAVDGVGNLEMLWSVPTAPAASADAAPRGYVVDASGAGADGGTHAAYMIEPLVAYPDIAPCAVADSAATTLGAPVRVAVLANDVVPTGGSLDAASVRVRAADGGSFAVDSTTGAVTFTPDAGFWGTVEASYVVYDSWGIGTEAALTITVDAGCTITGAVGAVRIVGTDGDDVICVPDRDDRRAFHVIDAKGGNDIVLAGAGVDLVYAGAGADTVYAGGGGDHIDGGAGADVVYGGAGMDVVYSTDLADTIHDDPGGSELVVAPTAAVAHAAPVTSADWHYVEVSSVARIDVLGNDYDPNENLDPLTLRITREPSSGAARVVLLAGGAASAVIYTAAGAGGTDSFAYEVCDSLGACSSAEVTVMVSTAGCTIVGTDGADTLLGSAGDDVICGLGGDDTIYGLGGDDIIVGGAGDDTLYGGDATLIGASDGDDLLWGGTGDDSLYGGNGRDTLWGGAGADMLYGNRRDDRIYGGDGDDTAIGGGENDTIFGGDGDDNLDGHAGNDELHGGAGIDSLRGGNGDDTLYGGPGADTLTGGAGADSLHGGSGDDDLDGNTQNDTLWGGSGDDVLDGQGHNDELHGGPGVDTLRGGAADDRVYGGSGNDSLDGGNGDDYLDGGADTDTCARAQKTTRCEVQGRKS